MRIGIDGAPLSIPFPCGTKHYGAALLEHLAQLDRENDYFVFGSARMELPKQSNFKLIPIPQFLPVFKRQFFLGYFAQKYAIDVFHYLEPYGAVFFRHPRIVTTVHDINLDWTYPWLSRYWATRLYTETARWGVLSKTRVALAVSNATARETRAYLAKVGSHAEVKVVSQGFDVGTWKRSRAPHHRRNYFLGMGDFTRRKNLPTLIKAFCSLGDVNMGLKLVVSSSRFLQPIATMVREAGVERSRVELRVGVSQNELMRLYQGAMAFIYPSFYEGFGLPLLEAMACGCPVVTTRGGAMAEVVGKAGILINPASSEEIAEAMKVLMSKPRVWETLCENGWRRTSAFSWDATARQTLEIYKSLLNDRTAAKL